MGCAFFPCPGDGPGGDGGAVFAFFNNKYKFNFILKKRNLQNLQIFFEITNPAVVALWTCSRVRMAPTEPFLK